MDYSDETLFRIYSELLFLKPTIKWLLEREARRSRNPSMVLRQLSELVSREITASGLNEAHQATAQEGLDRLIAEVLSRASRKSPR